MKLMRMSLVLIVGLVVSLAVTNAFAQLRNDTVLSQHIKEADGTSGQNTNSGSGIKTGHIQNGAVTDAKITGQISAAKIQKPSRVITVAQSGGDFTSVQSAINSINPSASDPYLIKVMPGTYVEKITLKSFVHLEGSGANVTTIQSPCPSCNEGIINISGLSNVAVSDLRIYSGNSAYINCFGIANTGSSPLITGVTFDSHAEGIRNEGSSSPIITSNLFTGNRNGISYSDMSGTSYGSIRGNTIAGPGSHPGTGILLGYASPTIAENIITGYNTAIYSWGSSPIITSNTIKNGSYEGICVVSGGAPIIRGNTVDNCGDYGIRVLISSSAKMIQNVITNHGLDVWVDDTSTANVSYNIYDTISETTAQGLYNVKSDGSPAVAP